MQWSVARDKVREYPDEISNVVSIIDVMVAVRTFDIIKVVHLALSCVQKVFPGPSFASENLEYIVAFVRLRLGSVH